MVGCANDIGGAVLGSRHGPAVIRSSDFFARIPCKWEQTVMQRHRESIPRRLEAILGERAFIKVYSAICLDVFRYLRILSETSDLHHENSRSRQRPASDWWRSQLCNRNLERSGKSRATSRSIRIGKIKNSGKICHTFQ